MVSRLVSGLISIQYSRSMLQSVQFGKSSLRRVAERARARAGRARPGPDTYIYLTQTYRVRERDAGGGASRASEASDGEKRNGYSKGTPVVAWTVSVIRKSRI